MFQSGTSYLFVPKGNMVQMDPHSSVHSNGDGSLSINYAAREVGCYEFNIMYNETQLEGTPLRMNVGMVGKSPVSAYGPGLVHGKSGQKTYFHVAKGAGLGQVKVDITGPEKTEVTSTEDKNGTRIEYTPLTPGEYLINVQINGTHIHGSPFSAKISGQGTKKSIHQISSSAEYSLGVKCSEITGLLAYLKPPSSLIEQVSLKRLANGDLGLACFQPHKKGIYTVDVSHDGSKFKGSPFQINVGDKEVCDPEKVKVSGAIKEGQANQWNSINIDVSQAGFGELSVSLEGSDRSDIKSKQTSGNPKEFQVFYFPPEPGTYILGVKMGGEHVAKSPFMVNIGGKSSGRIRSTAQRNITGAELVHVGETAEFCLTLPGCSPLDMEASLTSPSGRVELCEVRDQPGGKFLVKFTPSEKGLNIISLKMKGIHINGSPLPFTIGSSPSGGTRKVEFGGVGLERGVVGVKNEFNVYTREAGPGLLAVAIDGPSKATVEIRDTHTGFAHVIYSVEKEGEYMIGLKYDGIHVPRSPVRIQVDPDCKEAKKITIQALRDRGLEVNKATTFQVNLNGVQGNLTGYLTTPTGAKDEIVIEKIDADQYMIRFMPHENGLYYVAVKFNDSHIPGSPLPMLVGKLGADPALVKMEGKGLISGTVGSLSKFYAITANAGSGPLSVEIEGPSRVAISCSDLEDGYEFSYTPTAAGEHLLSVKFCNVNVPGSPFLAKVGGVGKANESHEVSSIQVETEEKKASGSKKLLRGEASKVVVSGPGLKKGFISRLGNFNVDYKEAGFALMVVAMVSPKGFPVKELTCKKQKPGIYAVTYLPEEKGDHCLHVRWGEDDVPGSPFVVPVA